jgi:hypothetical protein
MQMAWKTLSIFLMVGSSNCANAQERCPELIRLRSEAAAAQKQTIGVPTPDRCVAYARLSRAWGAIVQYASDHREQCGISSPSLEQLERSRQEAAEVRKNACAGRPPRAFPPEIIK